MFEVLNLLRGTYQSLSLLHLQYYCSKGCVCWKKKRRKREEEEKREEKDKKERGKERREKRRGEERKIKKQIFLNTKRKERRGRTIFSLFIFLFLFLFFHIFFLSFCFLHSFEKTKQKRKRRRRGEGKKEMKKKKKNSKMVTGGEETLLSASTRACTSFLSNDFLPAPKPQLSFPFN